MCSTNCVEHRLGCLIDSRNYAECIPLEECEARKTLNIVIVCVVVGLIIIIAVGCFVRHKCKHRSNDEHVRAARARTAEI